METKDKQEHVCGVTGSCINSQPKEEFNLSDKIKQHDSEYKKITTNYDKDNVKYLKEFNLSDKIHGNVIHEWEVKEFIKRLKDDFPASMTIGEFVLFVNKLVGDKLK